MTSTIFSTLLACTLGAFGALQATGATVQTLETTKTQATTCTPPPATTSFSTTDSSITAYLSISGLQTTDKVILYWNTPSSGAYETTVAEGGPSTRCYAPALTNAQFAPYPGTWSLTVSINGVYQPQRASFTVTKAGGNKPPTLTSVQISRTTLSNGRVDSVRHASPTNPWGLQTVAGFGAPNRTPVVAGLFTVIQAQANPLKITLSGTGNPIVASGVNLPSCFTLAVAEGLADPNGYPVGARWTRPNTGTLYASVAMPSVGITAGMELATNTELQNYTANSIIWEAPPIGTLVQSGPMGGGGLKLQATAIDQPPSTGTPLTSAAQQSDQIDWAETIKVAIMERCKEKNADGTFTIGLQANITGNFEPVAKTWFRWAFQGNTTTIVEDKAGTNQISLTVPAKEAGVSARVTVVASSLGSATTGNPSPFTQAVPPPPQSVGLDTFNSSGGSIGDAASVVVTATTACGTAISVAAGGIHSLALRSDGTVVAWGDNSNGQLGDGKTETNSTTAVSVKNSNGSAFTGATAIAAGQDHSLAVVAGGEVYAWGANDQGQLGDGTTTERNNPVQVKLSSGAPLANVVALAAGDSFSLALTATGTVYAWGTNWSGQLGIGTLVNSDFAAPVKLANGSPLSGVRTISAGGAHSMALTTAGVVYTWGSNQNAELGNIFCANPTGDSCETDSASIFFPNPMLVYQMPAQVVGIAAGTGHSLALTASGGVYGWGNDILNLPGLIPPANDFKIEITNSNGSPFSGVSAIAAGCGQSLAIAGAVPGAAESWGLNYSGQLGDGTTASRTNPVGVVGLGAGVMEVSAGRGVTMCQDMYSTHSLALKSDGTVWGWGLNSSGQLGNKTTQNSTVPVQVTGM